MRRTVTIAALAGAAVIIIVLLSAGGSRAYRAPRVAAVAERGNAPRDWSLWVNPASSAARQAKALAASGNPAAAPIARLAAQPTAVWIAAPGSGATAGVAGVVRSAAAVGRLPVLVSYEIPHRDCGGASAGGAPSSVAYLHYVATLDRALGAMPAMLVIEPDAVAQAVAGCLHGAAAQDRLSLISRAIAVLSGHPGRFVYLDAGHPGWVSDLPRLARALRAAGVRHTAGFALNVSSFSTTRASIAYGHRLSRLLGGAHFVIDTSRNGAGPATDPADAPTWCNPPGRRVGHTPTTRTDDPLLDAYLWVKPPGDSDGACRPGALPAGRWSLSAALQLLQGASLP